MSEFSSNGENYAPEDSHIRPDEVVDSLEQQIIGSGNRERRGQGEAADSDSLSEADSDAAERPHGEPPS